MFTKKEVDARNYKMKKGIELSDITILSSEDAKNNLIEFYPEMADKAQVMNFVASVPTEVYQVDILPTIKKYNLPDKYTTFLEHTLLTPFYLNAVLLAMNTIRHLTRVS